MKKKLLFSIMAVAAMLFVACQDETTCRIYGTVVGDQYEGKRVFLVPFSGPATAETVDSIEVKDGKFEFSPDSMQMYKILLDIHYRYGLQPLILVAEPGDITVVIDSISSAKGTPQNDSLQVWKEITEYITRQTSALNRLIKAKRKQNDTIEAVQLEKQVKDMRLEYKRRTRAMGANMEGTILGTFLSGMFPLTYKRTLPDGTVVEMDADTNQPVSK